jgi:maleamate amidohydrolase
MPSDDLTESYSAFDGHLAFGQTPALLIVDFVMAYLDPTSPLFAGAEAALASNVRLLAAARAAGVPVIFTKVEYTPGGANGGLFYRKIPALKVFDAGSPLGEFPASLQPVAGETVVTKQFASAFFDTLLAAILSDKGIDTLLITGMSTSGCVRATALDALQNGFAPFVISDACGDRHAAPHSANLFDLQAKYAEVISEEQANTFLNGYVDPTS